jgi:WD40 repeat protein/DNA-binding SARP family transcriptional activator
MRFKLLGPLEAVRGADRVALGGPKQRLVLALLLIRANQVVSTERLIDEIWEEDPPDAARPSLQSYVSHLRKALGPDRLEGRTPGYVLHASDDEVDARRFEALATDARRKLRDDPAAAARALRDALAMWRGDPLADLSTELSLQPEIERLSGLRLAAIEDRIEAELALGQHAELAAELETLTAEHPLRERLHGHLMLALYRAGRQAEALNAYHRLREALASDLGLDPSTAIEALQHRILTQDASLDLRGTPLRGYRTVGVIGAGPIAEVLRAIEPQSQRDVAIKVLPAAIANDPQFIRRFDSEARKVARLEHPHIVPLHDWWREPDAAYLVMRLMHRDLGARLAEGHIGSSTALRWAEQIGSALVAAHGQGMAHGDLHAGNVLVDEVDNAYVADWGIGYDPATAVTAKVMPSDRRHLAPERRSGTPPSSAADIYAFGVLLSELFTRVTGGAAGAELRSAVEQATDPAPDRRQKSAADLVAAARRALLEPATEAMDANGSTSSPRNPYRGLTAFEEADAADFFGREDLVRQLVRRVGEPGIGAGLMAVVGPSGSGKSSVVHAGLIPALRTGAVPGSDEWLIATMTPTDRPFHMLERALVGVAVDTPMGLGDVLASDGGLGKAIRRVLPPGAHLLLVIDQFEEIFTLVTDAGERDRFLDLLAESVDLAAADLTVVATLRADFYDRPLRHERFGRLLAERTVPVPALDPEELERVVSSPARRAGVGLESGLVARVIAEMREQPAGLPLLQYALTELWERREGSNLSVRAYDASGGIGGAIARRAEQIVRDLDADGRELARQLFLRLIELGEGTPDTSRRVRTSELQSLGADRGDMAKVIERFARHRLLVFDRDPQSREPTLGLAHEALLAAWPRVQQWVDDARDDVRQQRRMAAAAGQWIENSRDPSYLLSGSRLDQANQWIGSTRMLLGSSERDYLAASMAERERVEAEERERTAHEAALERRAVTRLRALVVALGVGALVAGGLSLFALAESQRANRETRTATARGLAAAAVANLDADPEQSILLALQAIDETRATDGTVLLEAEEALHRAVVASRAVLTIRDEGGAVAWVDSPALGSVFVTQGSEDPADAGVVRVRAAATGDVVRAPWSAHDDDVNSVAFSADGTMLATSGDDGFLRVWDLATGKEPVSYEGLAGSEGQVWGPSFSPDGTLVAAIWTDEGRLRVLRTDTREPVLETDGPTALLSGTAFSPSGERLAITEWQGDATVIDVGTGEEVERFEGPLSSTAWSPDGRWILTAGFDGTAKVWEARTGVMRFTLFGHSAVVLAVDWSPDAARIATGSGDGTAKVWQLDEAGPRELFTLSSQDLQGGVGGVAFSPDGTKLLTGQFIDAAVKVWDIGIAGDAEWINRPAQILGEGGLAFAADGSSVIASSDGGTVTAWDPTGGAEGLITLDHESWVLTIDTSPDGRWIASGGEGGTVKVWDRFTGELHLRHESIGADASSVDALAWGSDEVLAIARNGEPIVLIDSDGNEVASLPVEDGIVVAALAFRHDGDRLATSLVTGDSERWEAARHQIEVWDWRRGEVVEAVVTLSDTVAFDPTGERIATAHPALEAPQIWDLTTNTLEGLDGGPGGALDVAWSPDGALIATAGTDGVIRLWDSQSGTHRLALHGHRTSVDKVRFSPDGSKLASVAPDGTLRIWALDLDDLIDLAWGKLSREFTDADCQAVLQVAECPDP